MKSSYRKRTGPFLRLLISLRPRAHTKGGDLLLPGELMYPSLQSDRLFVNKLF